MQTVDQEWGLDPNDTQALAHQQQLESRELSEIAIAPATTLVAQPVTTAPAATPLPLSTFDEMWRMAQVLANAHGMVPTRFIGKPESIFVVLDWARTAGIPVFTALQGISIIEGSPYIGAELVKLLVLRHPDCEDMYVETIGSGDDMIAIATIKRRGKRITIERFSVADAKVAKLWGKVGKSGGATPWVLHPKKMMEKVALVRAARRAFPDALWGMYPVDERELAIVSELPAQNVEALPDYQKRLAIMAMVEILPEQQRFSAESWLANKGGIFQLSQTELANLERRCNAFSAQKRAEARQIHAKTLEAVNNTPPGGDDANLGQIEAVENATDIEPEIDGEVEGYDGEELGPAANALVAEYVGFMVREWPRLIKPNPDQVKCDEILRDRGIVRFGPLAVLGYQADWHIIETLPYDTVSLAFSEGTKVFEALLTKTEIDLGLKAKAEMPVDPDGLAKTKEIIANQEGKLDPINAAKAKIKAVMKRKKTAKKIDLPPLSEEIRASVEELADQLETPLTELEKEALRKDFSKYHASTQKLIIERAGINLDSVANKGDEMRFRDALGETVALVNNRISESRRLAGSFGKTRYSEIETFGT